MFPPKAQPVTQPKKYRWLENGATYTYTPRLGKGDDGRRGQSCVVVNVLRSGGGPGNARVHFEDGHIAIVPAGVLKKLER